MQQINKRQRGFLILSTVAVFVVLSVFAVLAAMQQYRPEWPMPKGSLIMINEGIALLITIVWSAACYAILYVGGRRRRQ